MMINNIFMKIGICGNRGSFSEEATEHYCQKEQITQKDYNYLVTAENVLTAVENETVEKGIFPIENSNGGVVIESVYAMAHHVFAIEKLFEIDIRHFLLARKGVKTDDIVTIASHPQALKQCRMYLKRIWSGVDLKEYEDTAQAAKDLADGKLEEGVAVIAPEICAKLYELDVLEENIQDLKFNFTTFVVAQKEATHNM